MQTRTKLLQFSILIIPIEELCWYADAKEVCGKFEDQEYLQFLLFKFSFQHVHDGILVNVFVYIFVRAWYNSRKYKSFFNSRLVHLHFSYMELVAGAFKLLYVCTRNHVCFFKMIFFTFGYTFCSTPPLHTHRISFLFAFRSPCSKCWWCWIFKINLIAKVRKKRKYLLENQFFIFSKLRIK